LTRRRAILVATVLETTIRLTDDAIDLFDRLIGRLFRRAEAHEASTLRRDARAINAKVRLFAQLGEALLTAREMGSDPLDAVAAAIGWNKLEESVEEAKRLVRPDGLDYLALAARGYPIIRKVGPLFLEAFELRAVPAAAGVVRAAETMRAFYRTPRRPWPRDAPTSFIKKAWRPAVFTADGPIAEPTSFVSSPCSANGFAPAMSGSRVAANTEPSRTSSSPDPCSRPCARPARCRSPSRPTPRPISRRSVPCSSSGWPR
jgi:SAM-dependent methyltransferase